MSAIAGIIRFDGQDASARDLDRMLATLRPHGPDRSGNAIAGSVALGHVLMRLTHEDSLERQPRQGSGGAILAADARIDNRDELAQALQIDPQHAESLPDSAFILAAWEKWGNEAWVRLRGPFAAAIWDARARVLVLARDPMGLRALCIYHGPDFLAFATMPKGLFALGDVPRELNREKFADFLVLNHSDCETTVYRGISRLHPGHFATVSIGGAFAKQRFWSEENVPEIRLGSDEAYADGLREALDRAVRRTLRTTHGVASFLSGGLDSSSVAALAARALNQRGMRLPTYSQVPVEGFERRPTPTLYFDETPYVESIRAQIPNIGVTYIRSGHQDDLADLDRLFGALDGPVRNVSNLGWTMSAYRLSQSNGQRVLLSGDAGNLAVSWDGWEQAVEHLLGGRFWTAFQQWRLFYQLSERSRWGAIRQLFLEPLGLDPKDLLARWQGSGNSPWSGYSAIHPAFAERTGANARLMSSRFDRAVRGHLRQRMRLLSGNEFRGEWEAGVLALFGVDIRDPTSDLDVVNFCLGIPPQQFLTEGIHRSLLRRAMWGLLPAEVLTNRRRGQQASDWFQNLSGRRTALAQQVKEIGNLEEVAGMIDIQRLERLVADWPEAPATQQQANIMRLALPRALASGQFARLFYKRNRSGDQEW